MTAFATSLPRWEPRPDVWLVVVCAAALFYVATTRLGPTHAGGRPPVTRQQAWCFGMALFSLWLVTDWPVDEIADQRMFSVHMVQHMVLIFVVPAFLLLGIPGWLLRVLLQPGSRRFRVIRQCARPIPALVIFSGVFVCVHIPALINASVQNAGTDFLEHTALLAAGLIGWLPVLSPLPEIPRLQPLGRCLYLFGWSVLPTIPASFLTFGSTPLYSVYRGKPKLLGLSTLEDQQLAGVLMKIGMGLLLWTIIAVIFFRWAAAEERREQTARIA